MSTEPSAVPPNIAQLTGPLLLGNFFNWGLLGVLSVQIYIYYLAFPNDRRLPKCLVAFIYAFEVVQTVLVTRDAFRVFGTGWGNLVDLNLVAWIWFSIPVMTGISDPYFFSTVNFKRLISGIFITTVSCVVQLFFAWRIYILSHMFWIPSVVTLLSIVQMVAGVWSGVNANIIGLFSILQDRNYKQTSVWLGGTALVDVIITVSMIFYLSRSRTGFRSTNALVTKFIRITVETGLVCATLAILDLSLFLGYKDANYHLAPAIALSKLYSNSLLVVLNARVRIVGGRNLGPTSGDTTLSFASFTASHNIVPEVHRLSRPRPPPGNRPLNIAVSQEITDDALDDSVADSVKFDRDLPPHDLDPHKESDFAAV